MIALLGLVKTPRSRDRGLIKTLRKTLVVLDHVRGLLLTMCYLPYKSVTNVIHCYYHRL